ncbi:MAG TPA: S1C family serine protease [Candidatus Binatia bacterium]|nr:S1C family serine protease [Candidatus Binatia bacterium]
MARRLVLVLITLLGLPAAAGAVPGGPEFRLHPNAVAASPTYIRRVEPALVALHVQADPEAPSSARLGRTRFGTAVVFDPRGYAVTVGYVVMDAVRLEAQRRDGRRVPARVVGLDLESGLAVVHLEGPDPWPVARLGDSRDVGAGTPTGTASVDEDNALVEVVGSIRAVRRFSGYWEYMLDRAFLVEPASPSWAGAALVDVDGAVIGIGSLRLGAAPHVNLVIPIELFTPVKDELIAAGRVLSRAPRPWLGLYTQETAEGVVVDGFAAQGPARHAGFRLGDRIVGVNGVAVRSQEEFYAALWRGRAGEVVRIAVQRGGGTLVIAVASIDRYRLLRVPPP